MKGSVDLAQDLGASVVTFHMGGYHEGVARETVWRKAVEAIRAAADYAMAKHIDIAVDGIWPVWIDDSVAALTRLFADVGADNFGVNFDPCYLTLMGVDPVQWARHSGRIPMAYEERMWDLVWEWNWYGRHGRMRA